MNFSPRILAAVALGGATGSLLRWGVETALPPASGAVPWATLLVNVTGSALLGAAVVLLGRGALRVGRRAFLTTGLLGGFTTFSTYAVQAAVLLHEAPVTALVYALVTPVTCVAAAALAAAGVRRHVGAP